MRLGLVLFASSHAQECAEPEPIANASVVRNGNKASHTCDVGFCFVNERTRTIQSTCEGGSWGAVAQECAPCEACTLPSTGRGAEARFVTGTMDAEITCLDDLVVEPGTDKQTKVISCIEGGKWNSDVPVCSKPPVINCADEYMEAVIDKNMLRAKNWDGGADNIFLAGPGTLDVADADPSCFSVEDEGGNYRLRINSPFMNQCGTQSTIEGDDYVFSNIVKWQYASDFSTVSKEANVLDFKCVYRGVFMAGLPHKVKLAINTKTYQDDEGDDFTVSMSVYDKDDFTGLVDNIPILHRGKRYFVDLHLHNADRGTPFLRHCYGSNNYVSEEELREKYRMTTASSSVRNMVVNGCPAPMTLVNLEQSPNTYQSRFSFMFPKIGRGIADLQFVYLHCEIELMPLGFAPTCDDSAFGRAIKTNINAAKGIGARAFGGRGGGFGGGASGGVNPKDEMCSLPWMKNAKICQEGARRRRRSVSAGMSVGFGPVVLPEDQSVANERPSAEALLDVLGNSTNIFADEIDEEVEAEIAREEIEIVEMEINRETYRKRRKVLIISAMAAGCFLLFVLSVLISSRASCVCKKSSDRKKTSRKITTNVLASQIQRELAHASNI